MVSPLEEGCESYFRYTTNGNIRPAWHIEANKERVAKEMIKNLNLDCERLRNKRKRALVNTCMFTKELTVEDIDEFIELYDDISSEGRYEPFCQAILARLREEQKVLTEQE